MSLKLLCFLLTFLQAFSLDYQDRGIYYGERDNVCRGTHDLILLRINLDGKKTVTHTAWGETSCDQEESIYWKKIFPTKQFIDSGKDYRIFFSQETKVQSVYGVIQLIVQRSRVVNATFSKMPYRCEIIGDGTVQHFGIDIPDSPPCTHYLKCDKISSKYD